MKKFLKDNFFVVFLFLIPLTYAFRELILHLPTSLLDRYDYPYIIWVINSNIQNIVHGNFAHYFNTRGFFPHPYGLLFSDILLPQSVMILPFFLMTKNLILSFNIILLLTYVLNFITTFFLLNQFTKKRAFAGIGSLLVVFGPFFHMQMAHFQMQSYWFGMIAFIACFKLIEKQDYKSAAIGGFFLGLQFLASVYLFIFFSTAIFISFALSIFYRKYTIKSATVLFSITGAIILPFVMAYYRMKHYYGMERDVREVILYAAHVSDYLFTNVYRSFLYHVPIWAKWNIFDKHVIGEKTVFPGFTLIFLSAIGLIYITRSHKQAFISLSTRFHDVLFMMLGFLGCVLSFGPRLSFNGTYGHIPTLYLIGMKFIPMLDAIRCPARWSFLLYLALVYFSIKGLEKLSHRISARMLIASVLFIFVIEYLPMNITTYTVPQPTPEYTLLKKICQDNPNTVLLEYPVTHFKAYGGIVEGLGYISGVQLSQVGHNCLLMNGYSGFQPADQFVFEDELNGIISKGDEKALKDFLTKNNVDVFKINEKYVLAENREGLKKVLEGLRADGSFEEVEKEVFEMK